MEEEGKIVTGQSADTDTVVASVKAYVNALNKLIVRRQKTAPAAMADACGIGRNAPDGALSPVRRGGLPPSALRRLCL